MSTESVTSSGLSGLTADVRCVDALSRRAKLRMRTVDVDQKQRVWLTHSLDVLTRLMDSLVMTHGGEGYRVWLIEVQTFTRQLHKRLFELPLYVPCPPTSAQTRNGRFLHCQHRTSRTSQEADEKQDDARKTGRTEFRRLLA